MIRLHIPQPLSPGAAIAPTLDQSRYLTQVMRLKAGDDLRVFNGQDGEWRVTVAEVLKKGVILRAEEQVRSQTSSPDVELLMAVVKKAPLEFVVEKATELGVRRIRLVRTRRTTAEHLRLDRLDAIAEESAEQCGRLDVPPVDDPIKLDALLDGWDPSRRLMFCDETLAGSSPSPFWGGWRAAPGGGGSASQARASVSSSPPHPASPDGSATLPFREGEGKWSVLSGPEGGFAPEERERLLVLPYAVPVSLGPRILRADTAAVVALTLWQSALGDWRTAPP